MPLPGQQRQAVPPDHGTSAAKSWCRNRRSNQCADNNNFGNRHVTVPVSSILLSSNPTAALLFPASRMGSRTLSQSSLSAWKALTGAAAGGQGRRVSVPAQWLGLEGLTARRCDAAELSMQAPLHDRPFRYRNGYSVQWKQSSVCRCLQSHAAAERD